MTRAHKTAQDDSARARAMLDQVDELIGVLQQLRPWLEAQAEAEPASEQAGGSMVQQTIDYDPVTLVQRSLLEAGPLTKDEICSRFPGLSRKEISDVLGVAHVIYDDVAGKWRLTEFGRASMTEAPAS